MIAWDYAHRQARIGKWEQIARDTARFRDRIKMSIEPEIVKVLDNKHRDKVYKRLYMNDNHE